MLKKNSALLILFLLTTKTTFAQSKAPKKKKITNPNACLAMPSTDKSAALNVLHTELQTCCSTPITGFYRNGRCDTGPNDNGIHVVCAQVTDAFLEFSKKNGNDLITPFPAFGFAGLKSGDKWCLCAARWREAYEAGVAPPIVLESTHVKMLEFVTLEVLKEHALQPK